MLTATERKQTAQDFLMDALAVAFYKIGDSPKLSEEDREAVTLEASKQMERIERLFGYKPGSWGRG